MRSPRARWGSTGAFLIRARVWGPAREQLQTASYRAFADNTWDAGRLTPTRAVFTRAALEPLAVAEPTPRLWRPDVRRDAVAAPPQPMAQRREVPVQAWLAPYLVLGRERQRGRTATTGEGSTHRFAATRRSRQPARAGRRGAFGRSRRAARPWRG